MNHIPCTIWENVQFNLLFENIKHIVLITKEKFILTTFDFHYLFPCIFCLLYVYVLSLNFFLHMNIENGKARESSILPPIHITGTLYAYINVDAD